MDDPRWQWIREFASSRGYPPRDKIHTNLVVKPCSFFYNNRHRQKLQVEEDIFDGFFDAAHYQRDQIVRFFEYWAIVYLFINLL
jgi:hypothetical protein